VRVRVRVRVQVRVQVRVRVRASVQHLSTTLLATFVRSCLAAPRGERDLCAD
jgi:hypothetical protein